MTDRRGTDYHNNLLGCDGLLQLSATDSFGFQILRSRTLYPEWFSVANNQPVRSFDSHALSLAYRHLARNWNWWATYDSLGRDFRADVGFIPRVDIKEASAGLSKLFWGTPKDWFRRIILTAKGVYTEDQSGRLSDRQLTFLSEMHGPLQSLLIAAVSAKRELFGAILFDQEFAELNFSLRPGTSLGLVFEGKAGDAIDYAGARKADLLRLGPGLTWYLGRDLQLQVSHVRETLKIVEGRLYTAGLSQAKLIYQWNVRAFVRAIFQYLDVDRNQSLSVFPDPTDRRFFSQFLFSYKINPHSLLFIGYSDNWFGRENLSLKQNDRTFFIKLSYAWQY